MPKPTITRPSAAHALIALSALSTPAFGDDARDLAARLRAETGLRAETNAWARDTPVRLSPSLLVQTRYMVSFRKDRSPPLSPLQPGRNDTAGFSIPRAQLRLDANIANEQLLARIAFDFGDAEGRRGRGRPDEGIPGDTGTAQLREAWAQYNFTGEQSGYYLKAGQFRSTLIHEESVAPENQLAVERSVTNELFAPGNTQGIALGFVGADIAWEASFNSGIDFIGMRETANTQFNSPFEADAAVTGRVDWKLAGDWSRFEDFTSWRGDDVAARVGAGVHWQRQGDTNPGSSQPDFLFGDTIDISNLTWTVDGSYESDGWNAFVAYVGHRLEYEYPVQTILLIQHGLVAQAGMFFTDDLEGFARFDATRLDSTLTNGFGTDEKLHMYLTVGMNWYITPFSHAAKFSFDVTTALRDSDTLDAGSTGSNSIFFPDPSVTGLLGDTSEEWVMRAQLQFLF